MSQYIVCALYKFVSLENYTDIRQPLTQVLEDNHIRGTLLLASEGINGTVAGSREAINTLLAWFKEDPRLADVVYKESINDVQPFNRTKVKLKKEIVTMGVEGIDPLHVVGTYVRTLNLLIGMPLFLIQTCYWLILEMIMKWASAHSNMLLTQRQKHSAIFLNTLLII